MDTTPRLRQVLVFGSQEAPFLSELDSVSKNSSSPFAVVAAKLSQALDVADLDRYDAIICVIQRPEDLTCLLQLRKAASETPLLVLTEPSDEDSRRKAAELGAAAVLPFTAIRELAAGNVARSLQTLWLARQTSERVKKTRALAQDIQDLTAAGPRSRAGLAKASQTRQLAGFAPILVEDNQDEALLLMRAFAKCRIPGPIEVLNDGEEAVAYLSGKAAFADRRRHPLPSLIILDLKLPRLSGFEVLEWIRKDPMVRDILVVILSASRQDDDVRRARALGVGLYLQKPIAMTTLEDQVREIAEYWLANQ